MRVYVTPNDVPGRAPQRPLRRGKPRRAGRLATLALGPAWPQTHKLWTQQQNTYSLMGNESPEELVSTSCVLLCDLPTSRFSCSANADVTHARDKWSNVVACTHNTGDAAPRRARTLASSCSVLATTPPPGPRQGGSRGPAPPILLTPKPALAAGGGIPSAQDFGVTGSVHTAPGRTLRTRLNLSREAWSATLDAVGTRAYQL